VYEPRYHPTVWRTCEDRRLSWRARSAGPRERRLQARKLGSDRGRNQGVRLLADGADGDRLSVTRAARSR
jgi:hypothetical protein